MRRHNLQRTDQIIKNEERGKIKKEEEKEERTNN